jgi:hypothetical protein
MILRVLQYKVIERVNLFVSFLFSQKYLTYDC